MLVDDGSSLTKRSVHRRSKNKMNGYRKCSLVSLETNEGMFVTYSTSFSICRAISGTAVLKTLNENWMKYQMVLFEEVLSYPSKLQDPTSK